MALEQAVPIKLPTFWTNQPLTWFSQTEALFNVRRMTADDTMYYYAIVALNQETASRLLDLLANPPGENKYNTLKQRLLDTFGLSEQERATSLLHMRGLGDSKPSALMVQMLGLMGDYPPCFLFKQFLERMPEVIRIQLSSHKHEDCRQLAKRADTLWTAKDTAVANAIQSKPSVHHPQITGRTALANSNKGNLCFYHCKFGAAALKCQDPCGWTEKGRQVTSNDNGSWPIGLPTVHQRQQERKKDSIGHGSRSHTMMPFGLRNAAQAFQRLMDETCRGLPFVFAYIEDILV